MASPARHVSKGNSTIWFGAFVLLILTAPCHGQREVSGENGPYLVTLILLNTFYPPLLLAALFARRLRALVCFLLTFAYLGSFFGALELRDYLVDAECAFGGGWQGDWLVYVPFYLLAMLGVFTTLAVFVAGPRERPKPEKRPGVFVIHEPDVS